MDLNVISSFAEPASDFLSGVFRNPRIIAHMLRSNACLVQYPVCSPSLFAPFDLPVTGVRREGEKERNSPSLTLHLEKFNPVH